MKELIEKLEDAIINHQYGVDDMGFCCVISTKTIVDTTQALTSVKSESAEEVEKLNQEDTSYIAGYERAMHDFANQSEAMKENAIKFAKYISNNKNNEWDKLYNIYLTNKEK